VIAIRTHAAAAPRLAPARGRGPFTTPAASTPPGWPAPAQSPRPGGAARPTSAPRSRSAGRAPVRARVAAALGQARYAAPIIGPLAAPPS